MMLMALWFAEKLEIVIIITMVKNLWRYDSVPVFIASIALMITFLNYDISTWDGRYIRTIVRISSTTFGVYLIHAHANICTEKFWQRIGMVRNMGAWWFALYQVAIVIGIFFICAVFDYARQTLFDKLAIEMLTKKVCNTVLHKWISRKE